MATESKEQDDLEHIFGMFEELTVGRIRRKSVCNVRKKYPIGIKTNRKTGANKDKFLHKPRTVERKSILKESKLKLPSNFACTVKKQKTSGKEISDVAKEDCSLKDCSKMAPRINRTHSCSMEFRNSSLSPRTECTITCNQHDSYDNESDELAEYFEQALFLPKPMSAMAEMMYG